MIDMPVMGATNWPRPSYDPRTELFYLNGTEGCGMGPYTTHPTTRKATAAVDSHPVRALRLELRTGKARSKHEHNEMGGTGRSGGILTTATPETWSLSTRPMGALPWRQQLVSPVQWPVHLDAGG